MRYLSTNFPSQYAAGCLLLFLIPVQQGCDENKNKGTKKEYLVKGILKGAENKKVFLEDRAFYHDEHPSDSVIADKNGQFAFNGSLKEPTFYMIRVDNVNAPVEFILENSRIDITGNTDSLWTAKVTGSKENDIYKELVPLTGYYDYEDQFNKIEIEYDSAKKAADGSALTRMKEKKKALQERFGSNFTILSVSLDDTKENWVKSIQKDKPSDWTHVSDLKGWKNKVASLYGVDAVPVNYLVDPEGRIVARNLRGAELANTLKLLIQ